MNKKKYLNDFLDQWKLHNCKGIGWNTVPTGRLDDTRLALRSELGEIQITLTEQQTRWIIDSYTRQWQNKYQKEMIPNE